jgi:hypothetical protein
MICGEQISCGGWGRPMAFCAARKAQDLPMCEEHFDAMMAEYGHVAMASGNAVGDSATAVRLLWEPEAGDIPLEASAEEMALYAPILDLSRSV